MSVPKVFFSIWLLMVNVVGARLFINTQLEYL